MQWLQKIEEEAAEEWWESLSPEQREVFCELQDSHHGLYALEQKKSAGRGARKNE
jgi:hypothetical protein